MKANIKLDLFRLTPVRAQVLLSNVAEKLDGNANFPTPPVSAVDLAAKADALEAAILEAINGSQAARAARDAQVMEVRGILRSVADYVRMVAQGDAA
ncbi:MAG TPA: hypothetical protein PLH93_12200, partial [Flavobacteriales bacterium]|nr:hypothetical protein [Flavobacteriales bacterium]